MSYSLKAFIILLLIGLFTNNSVRADQDSYSESCVFFDNVDSYSAINGIVDAEVNGWTHYTDFGFDYWRVITGVGVSFTSAFSVIEETEVSLASITDSFLVTPEIILDGYYYFEFEHKYDFESDTNYYDGGQIQITTNNGNSWIDLNQYMVTGGYNQTISNSFNSPIQGELAWAGSTELSYNKVQIDLTSFSQNTVKIRWRFVSGLESYAQRGWRIDNIKVMNSIDISDTIFKNDFELPDATGC